MAMYQQTLGMRPKPDWVGLCSNLLPSWVAAAWLSYQSSWYWSHSPEMQFGWMVLILCGFLVTEVATQRPLAKPRWGLLPVILVVIGVVALVMFQLYQAAFGTMPASLMALAFGVMSIITANIISVYGVGALGTLGFAFYFLLIALPMPSVVQTLLVTNLQLFVASMDEELLNLMGIPAQRTGAIIRLANGQVGVDDACSGFRSLQSSIMSGMFNGFLQFKGWGWRITLVLVSILLAILGNLGRTLFLCCQGAAKGIESIKGVHDAAGWSVMAFTIAGVGVASWLGLGAQRRLVPVRKVRRGAGCAVVGDSTPREGGLK
jgi:exosortase